jgi:hypothetical protein
MCLRGNVRPNTTFLAALVALLLFNLLQIPARLHPQFHPDLVDGVRGLFLGVAIGGLALTTWKNRRPTA